MMVVKPLGLQDYLPVWQAMQNFTSTRTEQTPDEIWLLEHPPVYTLGRNGKGGEKPETSIPVIAVDRGGQITYHGPGQLVVYLLLDLRRIGIGVKTLVAVLEDAVINLLRDYGIVAERRAGAPGVYVQGRKIAALGLRVKHGCTYHGLSLNVAMDTEPFHLIPPCGYPELEVTQMRELGVSDNLDIIADKLKNILNDALFQFAIKGRTRRQG